MKQISRLSRVLATGLLIAACGVQAQVVELSELDGANGFAINGIAAEDRSGAHPASSPIAAVSSD